MGVERSGHPIARECEGSGGRRGNIRGDPPGVFFAWKKAGRVDRGHRSTRTAQGGPIRIFGVSNSYIFGGLKWRDLSIVAIRRVAACYIWAGSQSTGQLRASSQNTIGEKPVILFRPVKITKKRGWRRRALIADIEWGKGP